MPENSHELAVRIVRRLQAAGHAAYFAGGCVRDRLMAREPKDYDVATAALPEQVLQLFPRSQQVGAAFGVILVKDRAAQVEVATFRADGNYTDGRHPDSVRFTTALEDANRRDFTCNGIFFDPLTDELHDFVHGRADIDAKILRAIGNPNERFAEDHLRMLRAIRFAARLEFTIEPATCAAIAGMQERITLISRERIGEELRLMLEHPTRVRAMELLAGFPALFSAVLGLPAKADGWPVLSGLAERTSRAVALAALCLDCGCTDLKSQVNDLRERLMLSNDETDALGFIAEKLPRLEGWEDLTKAVFKRIMADPRWPGVDAIFRAAPENAAELFAYAERTASLQEENVAPEPLVTGEDLIKLGARPGPAFKRWLDQLYDRQLDGEFAGATEALTAARALLDASSTSPPRDQ